jgi:hypothetical protein
MVSMQMTAAEAKEYTSCEPKPGDAPKYPYGLCLYLNDATLKKLGIELPEVGTVLTLSAKVVVTSVGMNQQQDGDKEERAEMQITEMELAPEGGPSAASVLYGG